MAIAAKSSSFHISLAVAAAIAVIVSVVPSIGQTSPQLPSDPLVDSGVHSYGTYSGFHDNVSLSSGNLSFCIPLVSLPGVNKLDVNIPLCYNSEFMELGPTGVVGTTLSWFPWVWGSNTPAMGPGWTLTGRPGMYASVQSTGTGLPMLFMPDGSKYSFPSDCGGGVSSGCGPDGQNANIYDVEGSPNIAYLQDGTTVRGIIGATSNQIYDTNGNYISYTPSSITDTVGRTINVVAGNAAGSSPAYISFQYPDPSGRNATVTVTVQMAVMQFTCNAAQNQYGINGTYAMPSAVILPNGLSYTFQYNSCGLLIKVTYPSGGYTRYDYTLLNFATQIVDTNGNKATSAYPVNELAHKYVCTSAVGAGSAGDTCSAPEQLTTYTPVASGVAYNNTQTTVVDPVGNSTIYQFSQPNPTTFSGVQGVETSRQFNDANGKFLKSVQTQYASTTLSSCSGGGAPSLPTVQTTILDNGMESQVQWTYDCHQPQSEDTVLTEKREYDFGQGSPGPLLRRTDYTWLQRDPTVGTAYGWPTAQGGSHILDKKTSEVVYDGSGNVIAQTKWVYDNAAPGSYPRGNLTSISKWRNTDNTWLTTTYAYDGHGNLSSKQDPNNNVTTYSYADNYTDGVNRNSDAFLTRTTYPNGVSTQSQYMWGSGLVAASCGENFSGTCRIGLSAVADYVSYAYDVMGRKTLISSGDGGQTTTCYSDTPGASCSSNGYPLTIKSTELISSEGVSKASTEVLDGVGRVTEAQLNTDPSCSGGTTNVDTYYDLDGRESTVSNPYCSVNASAPTAGYTTYTYDGLGRVTQVEHPDNSYVTDSYLGRAVLTIDEGTGAGSTRVQRVSQKDALGRLTSVCEVTGSTGKGSSSTPGACGLDIAGTGFLTQYVYDPLNNLVSVAQGGVNRSFHYDSLSELESATNPESGTTTYGYDKDNNLVSKTDQRGITTTYTYDALNRLTGKSYSDNFTPAACFHYDQGATNGLGHLTAEWTQAGTCGSSIPSSGILTERLYTAYDLMGRVAVDQQCASPGNCSGASYSVSYGYDVAGDVTEFTNGLTGASAMSFSSAYDSAGRLSTTTGPQSAGSSGDLINLFTAVDYTPASAIQDAQIGPGIALHRDYNSRLLPVDETDKVATTPGTATIQITGEEQFSGMTTGTITFSGAEQSTVTNGQTYYDSGLFIVSINGGAAYQIQYNQSSTPQSLAAYLPEVMSCASGPVKAVAVGATVTLTSCTSGTGTNYSISAYADGHSSTFANYSFAVTTSGPTMTLPPATYATGTVVITKIGQNDMDVLELFFVPTQYGSPASIGAMGTSSASAVASALAAEVPPCSSHQYFSAVANGSVIDLTSCTAGYGGNNPIQTSGGGDSFTMTPSGTTLTGGVSLSGVYDSGTVNLTVNGTVIASAPYGEGATPASIATALVASSGGNSLVTLSSSGANITMTAKGDGTITDYAYQLSTDYDSGTFGQPSFSASSTSGDLQGGENVPLYSWTVSSYAPDGNVLSVVDSVQGSWTYGYDDQGRITSGSASSGPESGLVLGWDYDRYGNRWDQNATGNGSAVQAHFSFSGNNNRIDNDSYDANGNLLSDGTKSYSYDAENHIMGINGAATYIYDAEGIRVAKLGTGGVITAMYILDTGNHQVTELNGSAQWQHTNVYASGGRLLATYTPSSGSYHYNLTDWLGTKRMQTTANGNVEETCVSYPFGDGLSCVGSADATEQHFTGKDRDAETGLDYFGARYYSSNFGRFMTPDWAAAPTDVPYAQFGDPQSLNLYGYVNNNPNTGIDGDGHVVTMQNGVLANDDEGDAAEAAENAELEQENQANANATPPPASSSASGATPSKPAPPNNKTPKDPAQQQTDNKPVGSTTVGSLEKTMTHEDGSLSTPKGGDPTELEKGKAALANAIINGAESKHPPLVATPTVPASSQDAQIMRDAYTNRANGGADPVNGRTFYGTSHTPPDQLHSRPIGNGRQTVYEHFGPFNDSVGGGRQTYIYIYNDPGH